MDKLCPYEENGKVCNSRMVKSGTVEQNLAKDIKQQYKCTICKHRTVNPNTESQPSKAIGRPL